MVVFLTSSPTGSLDGKYKVDTLDNKNHFLDQLKERWKPNSRVLMITAFPDQIEASEQMTSFFHEQTLKAGLSCIDFDLLDYRNMSLSICDYDVIFLGGGNVPTQNRFFHQINLREQMADFKGIVIGISAGSMNSADLVYAQPEEAGEATDPYFQRFIEGLNLTTINLLPHYQMVKDHYLDGMRLFEDITYANSYDHYFYAICDGTHLLVEKGKQTIYGECYCIHNGNCVKICEDGNSIEL